MKKITIQIDRKGSVTIEASGYTGNACATATGKFLEKLGVLASEEKKQEFHEVSENCLEK
jgi:Protein of unknown function (DUF2997)